MAAILENKKARFDYEILDTWESGIELLGSEVKALKAGHGSIIGAYVKVLNGEAYILGMKIDEYQKGNILDISERTRTRKLLLNQTELKKLVKFTEEKGLTVVPLSLYIKNRWIKLLIGVGKGKKKSDKRETIKKRDQDRALRREHNVR